MEMALRSSARISRLVLVDSVGVEPGGPLDRDIVDIFATPRAELEKRLPIADRDYRLATFLGR